MTSDPPVEIPENPNPGAAPGALPPRSLQDALHPWTILFLALACLLLYQIVSAAFWHAGHLGWGLLVAPALGVLLPVWTIVRRMGLGFGRALGVRRLSVPIAVRVVAIQVAALPVTYALSALNSRLWPPSPDYGEFFQALLPHDVPSFVVSFLAVVVVAPLAEEVIFRGLALPVVRRRLGAPLGIAITAVLFGAAHGAPWMVLPITFLGVLLGVLVWITGSLSTAWLAHGLFNLASFAELCLTHDPESSRFEKWATQPVVWATALVLLGVALVDLSRHSPRGRLESASAPPQVGEAAPPSEPVP